MEQEHIVYKNIYTILFICLMYICIFICEHVRSKTNFHGMGRAVSTSLLKKDELAIVFVSTKRCVQDFAQLQLYLSVRRSDS